MCLRYDTTLQNLCSHRKSHFLLIQHERSVKLCFVTHQTVKTEFCLDKTDNCYRHTLYAFIDIKSCELLLLMYKHCHLDNLFNLEIIQTSLTLSWILCFIYLHQKMFFNKIASRLFRSVTKNYTNNCARLQPCVQTITFIFSYLDLQEQKLLSYDVFNLLINLQK